MIPYLTEGLGIIAGGLIITTVIQHKDINTLEAELKLSTLETAKCKQEKNDLINAIDESNKKLLAIRVDYNKTIEDFNNREPEKIFIEKYVMDANISRGSCDDTSSVIDYVRHNSI